MKRPGMSLLLSGCLLGTGTMCGCQAEKQVRQPQASQGWSWRGKCEPSSPSFPAAPYDDSVHGQTPEYSAACPSEIEGGYLQPLPDSGAIRREVLKPVPPAPPRPDEGGHGMPSGNDESPEWAQPPLPAAPRFPMPPAPSFETSTPQDAKVDLTHDLVAGRQSMPLNLGRSYVSLGEIEFLDAGLQSVPGTPENVEYVKNQIQTMLPTWDEVTLEPQPLPVQTISGSPVSVELIPRWTNEPQRFIP